MSLVAGKGGLEFRRRRYPMAGQMKAVMWEWCSCAALCPCWLGPAGAPDKGWCAAAILYDIKQGSIDGVDVSGTKAVLTAEWPGNFFGGMARREFILIKARTTGSVVRSKRFFLERKVDCSKV